MISRQRRWQLKMRAQHRCIICGRQAGVKNRCRQHRAEYARYYRMTRRRAARKR